MNIKDMRDNAPKDATHYDIYGDYWKVDGELAYFMWLRGDKWTKYVFNDIQKHISKGDVKPL